MTFKSIVGTALCIALMLLLGGCGGGTASTETSTSSTLSATAALGKKIFFDQSLSASGQQACGTCHDPDHAFAGTEVVPAGGPNMDQSGTRNTPTLLYLRYNTAFFFDNEGTPTGGFFLDGRTNSFAEQARAPFLNPSEMANASAAEVASRLASASYVNEFTRIFGADIFDDPEKVLDHATFAIAQYEKEAPEFAPFTSKFDYFLKGKVSLTAQELRGFALFNNPLKGNCAGCHVDTPLADGTPPLFTDFTYDNLGVPRNPAIPANADPDYFDLGLCGPQRLTLAGRTDLCGAFKVPTLRNIALTAPYFHNGVFSTLQEVVTFYVTRDTNPELWYPNGGADKFNDLPSQYHKNVNTTEVPYNRKPGDQPALTSDEIDDVVAFLNTLTDGYQP